MWRYSLKQQSTILLLMLFLCALSARLVSAGTKTLTSSIVHASGCSKILASLKHFEESSGGKGFRHTYVAYQGEGGKEIQFDRTDRSFDELEKRGLLPPRLSDVDSLREQQLTVLDIGCGDGKLVDDLRGKGVAAFGVDILLGREQRLKSYFFEADASRIPLQSESVDIVVSVLSVYSGMYARQFSDARLESFVHEMLRVLKVGGRAYLTSPDSRVEPLAISSGNGHRHFGSISRQYVENGLQITEFDPPVDGDAFPSGLILEKTNR